MKNAFEMLRRGLVWCVVAFAVFMMIFTVISVTVFDRGDRSLLGHKLFIVRSDSMAATDFRAGDLILVKEADPSTLEEGDVISFLSQDADRFGETVTHKIRKKTVDAQGNPGFITYGTSTGTDDDTVVTYPYILGRYETRIPGLGRFFSFLKTGPGYFLCIFLPFALIILYEGFHFFSLLRRYKGEQAEALEEERRALAEQRAETEKMLRELEALQSRLETPQGSASQASTTASVEEPRPAESAAEPYSESAAGPYPAESAEEPRPAESVEDPYPESAAGPYPAESVTEPLSSETE